MTAHRQASRDMARLFTVGLRDGETGRLHRHLAGCPACAREFRRYQQLEVALCGDADGPSAFAVERVGAAVLDRAAPAPRWSWLPRAVAALAPVAAAAVALLVWSAWPAGPEPDHTAVPAGARFAEVELVAKGGGGPVSPDVGVRVFRVTAESRVAPAGGPLDLRDTVTFTYTCTAEGVSYLMLFGLQPGGAVRWYYPGYEGRESVRIAADRVDEPLGDGVRLAVNHVPGPLRLVALFSRSPLNRDDVEAAAAGLGSIEDLETFPAPDGVLQQSFLLRLAGGGS